MLNDIQTKGSIEKKKEDLAKISNQSSVVNNNKFLLDKKEMEKLKEKISIEEDDHNYTYSLKDHNTEEEEYEEDEYEEEETEEKNSTGHTQTVDSSVDSIQNNSNNSNSEAKLNEESNSTIKSSSNTNNKIVKTYKVDKLSIFKTKSLGQLEKEEFHDPVNINSYIHQVYKRGQSVDVNSLTATVPCYKLRHKFKIVKLFYDKKDDYFLQPYLIYFDEFFFYFIKNLDVDFYPKDDERRSFMRTIGKMYNIKKINKIKVSDYDEDIIKITITFKLHEINQEFDEEHYVVKDIYFDLNNADLFFKILNYFLTKYKIPMNIPSSCISKPKDTTQES